MNHILTEKQKRIISLSAQGMKNEAIALELVLSVNTIKYHKKQIFRKLDVTSIAEAMHVLYLKEKKNYPKV